MFKIDDFISRIQAIKEEFNIEVVYKRSGDTNSRRIAILINDLYLECGGDIHWASILERRIYEEAKSLNFTCDPIGYELDWEEVKRKAKDKNWNPLKLALDRSDKYLSRHSMIHYLSNRIIETLSKERTKTNGRENRKHIERRSIGKSFSRIQIHDSAMEKQGAANGAIGQ